MIARPTGVHHVALFVRELGVMETFYRDVLTLPVMRRWSEDRGVRSVWLDAGGGTFLALERAPEQAGEPDAGAAERPGFGVVALRIRTVDRVRWLDRLAAAGFAVYDRTPYTIYVRDPEGNRVGLSHWPEEAAEDGVGHG